MLRWLHPPGWTRVEVALFKGMGEHSYPGLGGWISTTFGTLIQRVHDARATSRELDSGGFLFDTKSQTLYINGFPGPIEEKTIATFEQYDALGQEIPFKHSKTYSDGRIKYRYYHLP